MRFRAAVPNRVKSMNNISFFQPGYTFGEGRKKSAFLPYAAGTVAAYAFSREAIRANYSLGGIFCFFEEPEDVIRRLKSPAVAAFSNYVWNFDYNLRLAALIKKEFPDCAVVFGGHQIPPGGGLLEQYTFIDCLIHGEGEETFAELAEALCGEGRLERIPSLSHRSGGRVTVNDEVRVSRRTDYPSPYFSGIFDELMGMSGVCFSATVETNRGCPYACAYCDWGITGKRLKVFPIDRIKKEIAWMAEHKIEHCFCADGNFGILERDVEIAELIIKSKKDFGYPKRFDVTYAKENDDRVFAIASRIFENKMSRGPSISFQSLNPEALKNVGRSNISTERFSRLLEKYNARGIPVYSEMILGLPGETYDSFCKGIGKLIASGQHNYIDIFRCEVLLNSELGKKEYRENHKIKTVKTPSLLHHIPVGDKIHGHSLVTVSTESMTKEEYIKANLFSMTIQSCHHMGLLRYAAIFSHDSFNIAYECFYNKLLALLESCAGRCAEVFSRFKKLYVGFAESGAALTYHDELYGGITWYPEEGFFLEILREPDCLYRLAENLLQDIDIPEDIASDLLMFQKNAMRYAGKSGGEVFLQYDWPAFFAGGGQLKKAGFIFKFTDANAAPNWRDYARENVWYGRRSGRTLHSPEAFVPLIAGD